MSSNSEAATIKYTSLALLIIYTPEEREKRGEREREKPVETPSQTCPFFQISSISTSPKLLRRSLPNMCGQFLYTCSVSWWYQLILPFDYVFLEKSSAHVVCYGFSYVFFSLRVPCFVRSCFGSHRVDSVFVFVFRVINVLICYFASSYVKTLWSDFFVNIRVFVLIEEIKRLKLCLRLIHSVWW